MSLRQELKAIIDLLDANPSLKIDLLAKPLQAALKKFKSDLLKNKKSADDEKPFLELKSQLVDLSPEKAEKRVRELSRKDFQGLTRILKISASETARLSAREAGQAKLLKKLEAIRKQTL